MRLIRVFVAVAALALIVAACGDDDAGTATTVGGGSETTVTTTGSGGPTGDANGSIVFVITGDYEVSDEYSFVPAASSFSNGGWSATFSDGGDAIIAMNTFTGQATVTFGDGTAVVSGGETFGCTFNFTQNDSDGFAGSFLCDDLAAFTTAGASIVVDFSGTFDAHV